MATSHGQKMRASNVLVTLVVGALHSYNVVVGPKVQTPRAPAAVPFPPHTMPRGKLHSRIPVSDPGSLLTHSAKTTALPGC